MTAPQGPQLNIAEVAAEMESDPLSKALFERAQLKVLLRQQDDQIQLLTARIAELERQKSPADAPPTEPAKAAGSTT